MKLFIIQAFQYFVLIQYFCSYLIFLFVSNVFVRILLLWIMELLPLAEKGSHSCRNKRFANFIPVKFRPIFEVNTITGLW